MPPPSPPSISTSGTAAKSTLETAGSTSNASPPTSLSPFSALTHLFLNATAICNTTVPSSDSSGTDPSDEDDDHALLTRLLPPNIESLCLAGTVQKGVAARMSRALVGLAGAVREGRGFASLRTVRCDVEMAGLLDGYGVAQAFEFAGVDFGWERWEVSSPPLDYGEGTPAPDEDEDEDGAWEVVLDDDAEFTGMEFSM
ncbi:hypothetical protein NEMBOFW57_005930 [Staphylotrichum longicolle]|uniref:Uncharacterized protein n=1 Tax=Staphylotrichum longicolle TaxID=669026 RepID=A0AAD4EXX8_9PEZI|nr:hypothetical protein NEMBOFW57_005930 [Staphylotrichum longicolle]